MAGIEIPVVEGKMPETEINEVKEPTSEVNEKLNVKELIERFAAIQGISYEEAEAKIGADTEEDILKNIQNFTTEKIKSSEIKLNRAQRRALQKKYGKNAVLQMTTQEQQEVINETAKKLNYIDLIQKLRKLNEQKAKENEDGETIDETN